MNLVSTLEAGRRELADAVSEAGEGARAASGWTVAECVEHVAIAEVRYLKWLEHARDITDRRDADRELKLFTTIRNRLTKIEAPEALRPTGRYATAALALAAFHEARDRTVEVARQRGDALYGVNVEHPHFGYVNGVELLQLIDGHGRRHAEQIREMERVPEKPVKRARAKQDVFRRDPPDLPRELPDMRELAEEIEEAQLRDVHAKGVKLRTLRIEGAVLERVQMEEAEFTSVVWKDVRLVGCDLANVRTRRMSLVRVELIDCRMTGLRAEGLEWQDVLVERGDLRWAQLGRGKFRACAFEGSKFDEADLQSSDLSGCLLRGCAMGRADARGAKMTGTDLRGSDVDTLLVDAADVRGAVVDAAQAMAFARLLGLKIQ